jgi:predicted MFS family arabinose efflux permease
MDAEDQSTGQSLAAMTESIGTLAGSLAGGLLLASSGVRVMLIFSAAAAAAGTLITFICGRKRGE